MIHHHHTRLYPCTCLSRELSVVPTCARDYFFVRCDDCRAVGPRARDREHALRLWNEAHQAEEDARQATLLIDRAARDAARAERAAAADQDRWARGGWATDPAVQAAILARYSGIAVIGTRACQTFTWDTPTGRRMGNAQAFLQQYLAPTFNLTPSPHAYALVLRVLHLAGKGWFNIEERHKSGAYAGEYHPQKENFVDLPS